MQFDADTVGSASPVADAEVCMMAADTMEALGLERGQYVMKFNSRKLLDGFTETFGIGEDVKLIWLRALDKLDRLGKEGVALLLGAGRKDESGDFTRGAGLTEKQIEASLGFATATTLDHSFVSGSKNGEEGLRDLEAMQALFAAAGYGADRIRYDSSVVRGLEYYTGPVFECELLMETKDEDGKTVRFGSVGGGGRYDDLVARFTGQMVPATGVSIGVSRLLSALASRGLSAGTSEPLVVVTVMDKADAAASFQTVSELRAAGIRAEAYVGTGKFGDQMKYADRRGAAIAVIEGGDERAKGEVTLKDLALGAELAKSVESRAAWTANREAQVSVKRSELVLEIKKLLRKG
jgi:histidyl-tRNA synthetase